MAHITAAAVDTDTISYNSLNDLCDNSQRMGFPSSSVGKEITCNAGGPSSTPGSGRPIRERLDYPLQYSWGSLVAQLVKDLPAIQDALLQFLGWEDSLEKG